MNEFSNHLPFDQFQRYWVTSQIASCIRKEIPVLNILDIGGYLGYEGSGDQENFLPITQFLKEDKVTVIDRKPFRGNQYIMGEGGNLPVKSESFNFVNVLDTLEHIPKIERYLVIHEAVRASNGLIVIGGPLATPETMQTEKLLASYLDTYLKLPNPALCEHLEYGLPTHEEIHEIISNENFEYYSFSYGNLYRWLEMMMLKHYLISLKNHEIFHTICDNYYNLVYAEKDSEPPCYRTFYVIAKKPYTKYLRDIQKVFPSGSQHQQPLAAQFPSLLKDILLQANIYHLNFLENSLKEKEATIAELQKLITLKDQHINNLEKFQLKVQDTFVYKLRNQIRNLKKRFYEPGT